MIRGPCSMRGVVRLIASELGQQDRSQWSEGPCSMRGVVRPIVGSKRLLTHYRANFHAIPVRFFAPPPVH